MSDTPKIHDTDEAWDEGELGRDERFVKRVEDCDEKVVDESLGLRMISIRLHKSLIEEFKLIAAIHGIGYQTLMRQSLTRFARGEMKRIARDVADGLKGKELVHSPPKTRKVA